MLADVPADLPGQAVQHADLHGAWSRTGNEVAQRVHEGVRRGTIDEMNLLQRRAQVGEGPLLVGEGSRRRIAPIP